MQLKLPLATLCAALSLCAAAEPLFEEVGVAAGLDYTGESWGGAWGDFNGDGWLDLWAPNHGNQPILLLNQQDGTFIDIAQQVLPAAIWSYYQSTPGRYDAHGAVWVDVDRDGDLDLFQAADGGSRIQPDHLYLNDGGLQFSAEVGLAVGADGTGNNSTMPLPADFNFDGLPDLIVAGALVLPTAKPVRFLQQQPGPTLQFADVTDTLGLSITSSGVNSGTVTDLDGDRYLEIGLGPLPDALGVFEQQPGGLTDITQVLGLDPFNLRLDVVVADFDNDLDDDVFMVRGEALAEVVQVSDLKIEASITVQSTERGFSFVTAGDISVGLFPTFQVNLSDIRIGASGYSPGSRNFVLDDANPANVGIMPHTPGAVRGYYIGFEPSTDTWTVLISSGSLISRNFTVAGFEQLSNLTLINIDDDAAIPKVDIFVRNVNGVFDEDAVAAGLDVPSSGRNIGAGDFDNDGDVDLYIVATGPVLNRDNLLYLNDGDGTFTAVLAHGAEGGSEGRGDAVAVADYDQDGFLDFFVSNGKSKPPFEADGRHYLFHNLGNDNHWLQIDLTGTLSAPNAAGAAVHLTAGGATQRRFANTGVHYRAQDQTRLHFGLGSATTVDSIDIAWPSGATTQLTNVSVDQIIAVSEPQQPVDQDGDGVEDALDNCLLVSNPAQIDSDQDGYGNRCDADFDNSCVVNTVDLGLFRSAFFSTTPLYDLDGDGVVNTTDLGLLKLQFFNAPGPSGTTATCP